MENQNASLVLFRMPKPNTMTKSFTSDKMKIGKRRIVFKILRMLVHSIGKRKWYLPSVPEITVDDLFDRINSARPPLIIDVRDRSEYEGADADFGHIQNARSIPFFKLASNLESLDSFKEGEVPSDRSVAALKADQVHPHEQRLG